MEKKLTAIVTGGKDAFGVWVKEYPNITSTGQTLEKALLNINNAIELMTEVDQYFAAAVQGKEVIYAFDACGAIKYYRQFIDFPGMQKIMGINHKQLWNYANGYSSPRKDKALLIVEKLNNFGKELAALRIEV